MAERDRRLEPIHPGEMCLRCPWNSQKNFASQRCFWCGAALCSVCAEQPLGPTSAPLTVYGCATCSKRVRAEYDDRAALRPPR